MEQKNCRPAPLDNAAAGNSLPLLARAIDSAGFPMLIVDIDDRVVWANVAYWHLSGFAADDVVGASATVLRGGLLAPHSCTAQSSAQGSAQGGWRREMLGKRRDGTSYISEEVVTPLLDQNGAITHYVAVIHDVTYSRQALQHERWLASQDVLTGLAGRGHIISLLNTALVEAERSRQILGLLFVDLDGFKLINDSHGHHVGDAVLKVVAARLQRAVRCSDTVARFGGDEFVILLPRVAHRSVAKRIGRQIVDQLSQSVAVGPERHDVRASVGIAFYPEHGNTSEMLLISADEAMYRAKKRGGSQIQLPDPAAEPRRVVRFRQADSVDEAVAVQKRDGCGCRHAELPANA